MLSTRQRLEHVVRRREDSPDSDDPAAGLVNLFDLWMVFAVAVLLTTIGVSGARLQEWDGDSLPLEDEPLEASGRSLEGEGTRLGIAYRLTSGEIVYVPEAAANE